MTIYKPKNGGDRKLSNKAGKSPIVWTTDDVVVPLTKSGSSSKDEAHILNSLKILRKRQTKWSFMRVCTVAVVLCIFTFAAFLGYFVHKRLLNCKPIIKTIHVQFHEYRHHVDELDVAEGRIEGAFYEQVEIDWKMEKYEKLSVPPFIDSRRSTIVHDFENDLTAIVDHDESRCFVIPLNRTIVFPPKRFLESVDRLKVGDSLPTAKVERQSHRVVTPPVDNTLTLGELIWSDCKYYDTYRLIGPVEPNAVSKQFDCQFSGETYSLGETGYPLMLLITLDGCA